MPVTCGRCNNVIPPTDLVGKGSTIDAQGKFLCRACSAAAGTGAKGTAVRKAGAAPAAPARPADRPTGSRPRPGPPPPTGRSPQAVTTVPGKKPTTLRRRAEGTDAGKGTARRGVRRGDDRSKMVNLLSLGGAGVLIVIAGFAVMMKTSEDDAYKTKRKDAEEAIEAAEKYAFKNPNDPFGRVQAAQKAVDAAKGAGPDLASRAKNFLASAQQAADKIQKSRAALTRLAEMEKAADDPARAAEVVGSVDAIRAELPDADPEVVKRVDALAGRAGILKAGVIAAEAKALEAQGPDAALAKYDEALEAARKQGKAGGEAIKAILADVDRVSQAKYDAGFEASVPDIDLLSGEWSSRWKIAPPEDSVVLERGGGSMTMATKPEANVGFGLVVIGTDLRWRDFIVDVGFVIEKRGFNFWGRCGRSKDVVQFGLDTDGGLKEGEPYQVTIAVKGMQVRATMPGQEPLTFPVKLAVAPSGGIGFALEPGAKVKFTGIKIKVLRSDPEVAVKKE